MKRRLSFIIQTFSILEQVFNKKPFLFSPSKLHYNPFNSLILSLNLLSIIPPTVHPIECLDRCYYSKLNSDLSSDRSFIPLIYTYIKYLNIRVCEPMIN